METATACLSEDVETEGFNLESGQTWIYPTNLPVRDYQYNIVKQAIYKNTMVVLPTGLGKTFIAAVVMYNFFRWYPNGKIIFMAPTKPLVKQQIDACYNIMAIPKEATVELTGSTGQATRDELWSEKRVFFITPQVLQNDFTRITKLSSQIKCLVFDEAHRARGNHAYCEVIKQISSHSEYFRVLALSASPGSTVSDVVKVCNSLLISHLEMRTETCADVARYVFKRTTETVVVKIEGILLEERGEYIKILDHYVRILVKHRVVTGNCANLSKGRLAYILNDYKEANKINRNPNYNDVMWILNQCLILYHAFELLTKHGLRVFHTFLQENAHKVMLKNDQGIQEMRDRIGEYLGPAPNTDKLPDGSIPDIPKDTKFGHPKFYRLAEIVVDHFKSKGEASRVMIFCEYQETVKEAYTLCLMNKPLVRPRLFLGQGAMTQKQQINVVACFRNGTCNTLISTCIGEEGLDIGEVDLVVCFDISSKSPIRMIQRMGRTGRKREGRIVMLVSEGREHQSLQECLTTKNSMTETIMYSRELRAHLYKNSALMVPLHLEPTCTRLHITVPKVPQKLKNNNLKSMFSNMATFDDCSQEVVVFDSFEERIPRARFHFNQIENPSTGELDMKNVVESQRTLQAEFGSVCASENSKLLVSLLQMADSKRFNLPQGQVVASTSKIVPTKKQGDIRAMFKQQQQPSSIQEAPAVSETDEDDIFCNTTLLSLNTELNDFLTIKNLESYDCKLCKHFFPCNNANTSKSDDFRVSSWTPLDFSILEVLNSENLQVFQEGLNPKFVDPLDDEFDDIMANLDEDVFENEIINENEIDPKTKQCETNEVIADENDVITKFDTVVDIEQDVEDLLNVMNCNNLDDELETVGDVIKIEDSPVKTNCKFELPKSAKKVIDMQTEVELESQSDTNVDCIQGLLRLYQGTLRFFKLESIDDLFTTDVVDLDATIINEFSGKSDSTTKNKDNNLLSNIKRGLKRSQRQLFEELSPDLKSTKRRKISVCDRDEVVGSKKDVAVDNTKILRENQNINFTNNNILSPDSKRIPSNKTVENINCDDIFDDDFFMDNPAPSKPINDANQIVDRMRELKKPTPLESSKTVENLNCDDIFDDDFFAVNPIAERSNDAKTNKMSNSINQNADRLIEATPERQVKKRRVVEQSPDLFDSNSSSGHSKTNTVCSEPLEVLSPNKAKRKLNLNDICDDSFLDCFMRTPEKTPVSQQKCIGDKTFSISKQKTISSNKKNPTQSTSFRRNTEKYSSQNSDYNEQRYKSVSQDVENYSKAEPERDKSLMPNTDKTSDGKLRSFSESSNHNKTRHQTPSSKKTKSVRLSTKWDLNKSILSNKYDLKKSVDTQFNDYEFDDDFEFGSVVTPLKNPQLNSSKPKSSLKKIGSQQSTGEKNQHLSRNISNSTGTGKTKYDDSSDVSNHVHKKSTQLLKSRETKLLGKTPENPTNKPSGRSRTNSVSSTNSQTPKTKPISQRVESTNRYQPIVTVNKSTTNRNLNLNDIYDASLLDMLSSSQENTKKSKNLVITDIFDDDFLDNQPVDANKNKPPDAKKATKLSLSDILDDSILEEMADSRIQQKKSEDIDSIMQKYLATKKQSPLKSTSTKCTVLTPVHSNNSTPRTQSSSKIDRCRLTPVKSIHTVVTPLRTRDVASCSIWSENSEDDFDNSPVKTNKKDARRIRHNGFIETEAEISRVEDLSSDEYEGGVSQDMLEASFVNDESQVLDTTNTRAHYLQSIRSPVNGRGKFKIPTLPRRIQPEIFSQMNETIDNTYEYDSFCVDSEVIDLTENDISELELAEQILKEKRRKKKKASAEPKKTKRRRILELSSDSDD